MFWKLYVILIIILEHSKHLQHCHFMFRDLGFSFQRIYKHAIDNMRIYSIPINFYSFNIKSPQKKNDGERQEKETERKAPCSHFPSNFRQFFPIYDLNLPHLMWQVELHTQSSPRAGYQENLGAPEQSHREQHLSSCWGQSHSLEVSGAKQSSEICTSYGNSKAPMQI